MTADSTRTFRARSTTDLALPVQRALADALAAGATGFHLLLAPGDYQDFALSLTGETAPGGLHLVVEGMGTRPVVLSGVSLHLTANRITLRNLELRGYRGAGPVLQVHAGEAFVGERLVVVDNHRLEECGTDPVVLLASAAAGGVGGSVTLRECWLLGNTAAGEAAVLATPRTGRAHLESLVLDHCVFAGNRATWALHPWFTRSVLIGETLIADEHLGRSWLVLTSPLVDVRIRRSVVALPQHLVEHRSGPDVAPADFPGVTVSESMLYLAEAAGAGVALVDCALAEPLALPGEVAMLHGAARSGAVPDPAALLRRLAAP